MKALKAEKGFYLLLGAVCAAFSVLLVRYGGYKTFWMDDIAQMDMVRVDSLGEMLWNTKVNDNNPPLSHFLSYIWIRIAPYGTFWLKLPNIVITVIGVWFCGLAGKILSGRTGGIISAVTAATTLNVVMMGAYTFRPYACAFTFSAVALYGFLKTNLEARTKKFSILYTLSLAALLYSHYFCIMVMGMFFLFELLYAWKEKLSWAQLWKKMMPYVLAGICFLPWFIYIIASSLDKLTTFWPAAPGWSELFQMTHQLLSYRLYVSYVVYAAAIGIAVAFFYGKNREKLNYLKLALITTPIAILGAVFVFSKGFDGFGSLWMPRYFICLLPFLFCLCGIGVGYVFDLLKEKKELHLIALTVCILFSMESFYNMHVKLQSKAPVVMQPYEDCADWLAAQPDLCQDTTLVFHTGYHMNNGWLYYLTRDGELEEPNVVNYEITPEQLEGIEKLYVVTIHRDFEAAMEGVINDAGFELVSQEGLPIRQYVKTKATE